MAQIIPTPLRQLMTEQTSLKAQIDKLTNDYDMLQQEKQTAIENYEKQLNEMYVKRQKLQAEYDSFTQAIEQMKQLYQIPEEEQTPPEETPQ